MSWQYSDAPNHIAPEVGPSLLAGDGPWSGVVLEPGAVYSLSVEVNAPGETTVGWGVTVTDGSGSEYVLADPADGETVPGGQWVTVTRTLPAPSFPTTATVTLSVPTGTQARNPSMGARTGRTILTVPGDVLAENIMASGGIVAGTPGGARVELTDEGLVAFDASGTETARIQGEGGEFVGGEFRTSDALPGQVTLSDDAYVDTTNGNAYPGISVRPLDPTGYESLPGIGPNTNGLIVAGGRMTDGARGYIAVAPEYSVMRTHGAGGGEGEVRTGPTFSLLGTHSTDGSNGVVQTSPTDSRMKTTGTNGDYGWVRAQTSDAELAYVSTDNTYFSRIRANTTEAHLFTRAGGANRYLTVDANGVWVKTGAKSYNLEETAQDSGWQALTLASGIASTGSPAWRNKGGVIYYRGAVTNSTGWAAGWNLLAADVTAAATPAANMLRAGVSSATNHMLLQVTSAGRLEMWLPASLAGSTTVQLSPMFYPLG